MENCVTFQDKSCFADIFRELDEFRKGKHLCDFVIKVGSESLFVHRLILSASSGYFKAMLNNKYETLESRSGFVEMKEVDPESVKFCIDFIYKGIVSVPNEIRENLIHVAKMLQLQKLCDVIANSYVNDLQPSNLFFTKNLAQMYACKNLEEKCQEFELENFVDISKMDEFKHFDPEYVAFLLSSYKTRSSAENKVKALISWTRFDMKEREQHFCSMLKMINLSYTCRDYRKHLIEKVDLVYKSVECVRHICNSFLENIIIAPCENIKLCSIALFDNVSRHLQLLNPISGDCRQIHHLCDDMMPTMFTAVTMQNTIYVFTHDKSVYSLEYADISASWQRLPNMLEYHGDRPPAVVVGNEIYVVGASSPLESCPFLEVYDPTVNEWKKYEDKNQLHTNSTPAYYEGDLYSIGGIENGQRVAHVEHLNPGTKRWHDMIPMNMARNSPSVTVFRKNLYVLGGNAEHDPLRSVEYYNSDILFWSWTWTLITPMHIGRSIINTFIICNTMFVVGYDEQNRTTIEKFDPDQERWEDVELPDSFANIEFMCSVGLGLL